VIAIDVGRRIRQLVATRFFVKETATSVAKYWKFTFHLSSVQLDHARSAITLLTINGDLHSSPTGHDGKFLSNHGTRYGCPVDRHLIIVLRPAL